jgi:hypothetical protein
MLTIETLSARPMTCPAGVQRDQAGAYRSGNAHRAPNDDFWIELSPGNVRISTFTILQLHRLFLIQEMFELGEVHLDALTIGSVVNFACCSGVEKDNCEC